MECAICLEEKRCFKILHCDHIFCDKCIEDLHAAAKAAVNSVASTLKPSAEPGEQSRVEREENGSYKEIECPKCRKVTKFEDGDWSKLQTKYFGKVRCWECDEDKSVDEFRWCHSCCQSACSSCFMDKHVNRTTDGKILSLHDSTKWDSKYPAARFCLEQLRFDIENGRERATKAKQYVRSYLEGLQEYMYVEIEQKTKASEHDHRQIMITLSESFNIDLSTVNAASNPNRSYQSMIGPLYELSGQSPRSLDLGRNKFKISSVPYKDLARHLLGTEKMPNLVGSNAFFDPSLLSRKFSAESVVIGANVIKHPSDICLLPNTEENTKLVLITDHETGVYLFKYPTMQLQGPLPLRQSYGRYARIAAVGEGQRLANSTGIDDPSFNVGRRRTATVMVTCQSAPNGPWTFILINVSIDGSKHEQIQQKRHHHFHFPENDNFHLMSSNRSLFGLSTSSDHSLWRFNGVEDISWKKLHTACQQNHSKAYCRIGPICDFNDHTEILITNGTWQSIDIVKIGWPDDKLWSVKRVELVSFLPNPISLVNFAEPALFSCYGIGTDRAVLVDRRQSYLLLFDRSAKLAFELAHFAAKLPQKVLFLDSNSALLIFLHKDNQNMRSLELFA